MSTGAASEINTFSQNLLSTTKGRNFLRIQYKTLILTSSNTFYYPEIFIVAVQLTAVFNTIHLCWNLLYINVTVTSFLAKNRCNKIVGKSRNNLCHASLSSNALPLFNIMSFCDWKIANVIRKNS